MNSQKENVLGSLLKKIDIFSVGVGFNIKQNEEFGTILGGLVFICYLVACLYFIIANFFDFANRSMFNQNTIQTKLDYAPAMNLLDKKLGFALGVTIDGSPKPDDKIFDYISVSIRHVVKYTENNTKVRNNLNLTSCTKEMFGHAIDEAFELSSLQNYFCIDPLNNMLNGEPLMIQGIYTEPIFQYLDLSISVKKTALNETDFLNSYFLEHETKVQMYYIDSSISVSNYSSPEKLYLNSKYLKLQFPFIEKANADFSNNTFDNDANILFTSSSIFNFYTLETFEPTEEFRGLTRLTDKKTDYDLLARLYIRSSQSYITYKRTYQKFTEYLADSTSIVSQVLIILVLVVGSYDQFKAKEYIIDNMLKYKVKFINKNPKGFTLMKGLFDKKQDETYKIVINEKKEESEISIEDKGVILAPKRKSVHMNYLCINPSSTNNLNNSNKSDTSSRYEKLTVNSGSNNRDILTKRSMKIHRSRNSILMSSKNLIFNTNTVKSCDVSEENRTRIKTQSENEDTYYNNFKIDKSIPLYMNYLSDHVKNLYKTKTQREVATTEKTESTEEKNNDETLVYSVGDLAKSLFSKMGCCKKDKHFQNKEILFEKGLERYLYNLDIFTYFTKMREVDILKHILLTSNQRAMLDFLSKPSISLIIKDSESPLTKSMNIFDNTLSNIENFYNSFVNCSNEYIKKKTESHEKLLKLTAYELYQLIQEEKVDDD